MSTHINRKNWPKKLLVEGKDDLYVIAGIRDKYGIPDNFEIVGCESVSEVKPKLLSYLKTNVEAIGIVVDADADTESVDDALKARWQSLHDTLVEQGYVMQKEPAVDGTIIPAIGRKPKIGIWLMPDNKQYPGMLEHFVTTLIPPDDKLKLVARKTLLQLEADGINKYKKIHATKAFIHTWLAWQEEPGKPMGQAITMQYLNHNSEVCISFAEWLYRLFNL